MCQDSDPSEATLCLIHNLAEGCPMQDTLFLWCKLQATQSFYVMLTYTQIGLFSTKCSLCNMHISYKSSVNGQVPKLSLLVTYFLYNSTLIDMLKPTKNINIEQEYLYAMYIFIILNVGLRDFKLWSGKNSLSIVLLN